MPTHDQPWLQALRDACKQTSQARVARQLNVSPSVVNQLLQGKYPGDVGRMKTLVEGHYMGRTVNCPVLEEIPIDKCQYHQRRRLPVQGEIRGRLYKACRSGCPHSNLEQTL